MAIWPHMRVRDSSRDASRNITHVKLISFAAHQEALRRFLFFVFVIAQPLKVNVKNITGSPHCRILLVFFFVFVFAQPLKVHVRF